MLGSEISDEAVRCLVSGSYAWLWSQDSAEKGYRGKYENCIHWSEGAKDRWLAKGSVPKGEVIHEHVVPRAELVNALLALRASECEMTFEQRREKVRGIFQSRCIGCVVLKTEDEDIPKRIRGNSDASSVWGRYSAVPGLIVGTINDGDPKNWQAIRIS